MATKIMKNIPVAYELAGSLPFIHKNSTFFPFVARPIQPNPPIHFFQVHGACQYGNWVKRARLFTVVARLNTLSFLSLLFILNISHISSSIIYNTILHCKEIGRKDKNGSSVSGQEQVAGSSEHTRYGDPAPAP